MFPFFPFVAGVLAGAVVLRLAKSEKTQAGLDKAQNTLRSATVSSLEVIEQASTKARQRLTGDSVDASASHEAAPVTPVNAATDGPPAAAAQEESIPPKIRRARATRNPTDETGGAA